eukprot:2919105-Alexandrium_andersonii.AAC.1
MATVTLQRDATLPPPLVCGVCAMGMGHRVGLPGVLWWAVPALGLNSLVFGPACASPSRWSSSPSSDSASLLLSSRG